MNEKFLTQENIHLLNKNFSDKIHRGCAVAVGGFDGVHLGHRALLNVLVSEAERLNIPAVVFTFDSDNSPKSSAELLTVDGRRAQLMADIGVDAVFSKPFSELKNMSAEDFVLKYLYDYLDAKVIVCGYDFRFGKDRAGDADLIRTLLGDKGVTVVTPDVFLTDGKPVSSTAIRNLLREGKIRQANRLLGWNFQFVGPVQSGAQLGRKLGFPTVNQPYPPRLVKIPYGVYAVKMFVDNKTYSGVANFGVKPTVTDDKIPVFETHLFDFSGEINSSVARVSIIDHIRPEQRFSSLEELKNQVERDKLSAKEILAKGEVL